MVGAEKRSRAEIWESGPVALVIKCALGRGWGASGMNTGCTAVGKDAESIWDAAEPGAGEHVGPAWGGGAVRAWAC